MVAVPTLDQFSVAPAGGNLPGVNSPPVQDFGSQQLEQTGRAITRAGAVGGEIFQRELQEMNQLRVDEAVNRAKEIQAEMTFDPNKGYSFVKGRDALEPVDGVGLADRYSGDFDRVTSAIAEGLGNDAQRRAFAVSARNMSSSFRNEITKHQAQEFVTYATSTIEGSIATHSRDISLGAMDGDPDKVDNAISGIRGQLYRFAQLNGFSTGEALDAAVRKKTSEALTTAISQMLDENNVDAAESFMDRYIDKMEPGDITRVKHAIGQEQDLSVSTSVASEYFSGLAGGTVASKPQTFVPPVPGVSGISSGFGVPRPGHTHKGIDIPTAAGSKVVATADGVVEYVGNNGSYGNLVKIKHNDGTTETRYAHLKGFSSGLKAGDRVQQGQVIAISGGEAGAKGAGRSTGPHLHYEVRKNGVAVDPMGQHTVSGSKRSMSLTETIQTMRSDPRLASNPRRLQEAERQVKSLWSDWKTEQNVAEQDATDAAMSWLDKNGGAYEKMPASLRNAVPGHMLDSLRSFSRAMKEETKPEDSTVLWGTLRDEIASGKITSPQQLIKNKPYLTDSDFRDLMGTVTSAKSQPETLDPVKTASGAMSNLVGELTQAGIDTSPKASGDGGELSKFRGQFYRAVAEAERAKGKPLTETEATDIGRVLLAKSAVAGTGVFGSTTVKRGYEFDHPLIPYSAIPPSVRSSIVASLQRQGKRPTEQAVRMEYQAFTTGRGR